MGRRGPGLEGRLPSRNTDDHGRARSPAAEWRRRAGLPRSAEQGRAGYSAHGRAALAGPLAGVSTAPCGRGQGGSRGAGRDRRSRSPLRSDEATWGDS
eukprot:11534371-Alexandrium_andersonii.AAC.1